MSKLLMGGLFWGAALLLSATAFAEDGGVARDKMVRALTESGQGKCTEDIMSPILADACEQQIDQNKKLLGPLGKIESATYRGIQEMGNGIKAEAYRVTFEHGTMMWIASLDGAGKLLVLWSNGQVNPK